MPWYLEGEPHNPRSWGRCWSPFGYQSLATLGWSSFRTGQYPPLQLPATDATDPWKIGRICIPKDCLFPCFRLKKAHTTLTARPWNLMVGSDGGRLSFLGARPVFRGELLVAGEGGRHVPRILSLQEPGDSLSCWLTKVSSISASSKSMTFWRPKN